MKIKYTVSIILILAVAVLMYYISLSKQIPTELNPSTPESEQQASESKTKLVWETYHSDLYNFSFEYKKGDLVVNQNPTERYEYYLTVSEFNPNRPNYSEYLVEFIIEKNSESEIIPCNQVIEDFIRVDFNDGYKVYSRDNLILNNHTIFNVKLVDEDGGSSETKQMICLERPDYTLVVHGTDFNDSGDNILDHVISSIKFTN